MLGRLALTLTLSWVGLPTSAWATTNLTAWVPLFKGIDHAMGTSTPGGGGFTELQVVHLIRVDLTDPDVRLFSSPPLENYISGSRETAGYTVGDFLVTNGLQVAINAGFFRPSEYYLPAGTPMDISGLSICQGFVVSQANSAHRSALLFSSNNVPTVVPTNWPARPTTGVYTAVSGDYPVLVNGVNVGYNYLSDPDSIHRLQPRTAYGVSQDKRYLFLITIDGRQSGYSVGAYDWQTAAWLIMAGAHDGLNMDGGGSSTLVVQNSTGQPVLLNRPTAVADSGRQRTVGSHFGVYAKPVPGFINEVAALPDDTTAVITWTTIEPATSQVAYGLDASVPLTTPPQTALRTNHAVLLTELMPDTAYRFQAISTANGSRYSSSNMVFTTTNYVTTSLLFDLDQPWTFTPANVSASPWTTLAYDDAGWDGSGPGLLWVDTRTTGPNPAVQPKNTMMPANPNNNGFPFVTYYLRTRFQFTNDLTGVSLIFSNYIDDGAVFYLNGAEIYRHYLPPAPEPIANDMLAIGYGCGGDATCPFVFSLARDRMPSLAPGDNVLAVEVHNYNRRSPDITFGTTVFFTQPRPVRPQLEIESHGALVTLSWSRTGYILQEALDPAGPWTDLPGPVFASPHTVPVYGLAHYYRLRK